MCQIKTLRQFKGCSVEKKGMCQLKTVRQFKALRSKQRA